MSFSWKKAVTIAEREYLTTVRRKAFLFTVIGTPVLYAILMTLMIRPQMGDRARQMRDFKVLGVVDSSGVFADAEEILARSLRHLHGRPRATKWDSFRVAVTTRPEGERALRAGESTSSSCAGGLLETGRLWSHAISTNIFSSQDSAVSDGWCAAPAHRVDPQRSSGSRARRGMELLTPDPRATAGSSHDGRREMIDFPLPFAFGMLSRAS
jgi:hypothetical protein